MASSAIIGLSSLAATYVFVRMLLAYTHNDREPTAVATEIPFLSPLIGMAKKSKFYTDLRCVQIVTHRLAARLLNEMSVTSTIFPSIP
jgi:hypothetical protein